MLWEEYNKVYYRYMLGSCQASVVTRVAREFVGEFPAKPLPGAPGSLKPIILYAVEFALRTYYSWYTAISEGKVGRISESTEGMCGESENRYDDLRRMFNNVELDGVSSDLDRHIQPMVVFSSELGYSFDDVDFNRLLCSQELVAQFTHLDAFMADSIRAICRVRPEVMKSDKKLDWENILECGGWEELLNLLSEQYVFDFGWQPVSRRVDFLRERLGFGIECPDLMSIEGAEKARHIIIHNGGRVNQEYISWTGRDDLKVGELIPVSFEHLDKVTWATRALAGEIFVNVSREFFDIKDPKLFLIWQKDTLSNAPEDSST